MTYNEFIEDILSNRGRFAILNGYKERHHIVPKCLGGLNDEDNLIDLTAQEHYEAHRLLALENPNNYKLLYAWNRVSCNKGVKLSADQSAELKEHFKHSEETKLKIGAANHIALKGRKIPKETVKNMTAAHIGLVWWTNGIEETKAKECPDGWYKGRSNSSKINCKKMAKTEHPSKRKHVKCLELNKIYDSLKQASRETGDTSGWICCSCKNNDRTREGCYHWIYI